LLTNANTYAILIRESENKIEQAGKFGKYGAPERGKIEFDEEPDSFRRSIEKEK